MSGGKRRRAKGEGRSKKPAAPSLPPDVAADLADMAEIIAEGCDIIRGLLAEWRRAEADNRRLRRAVRNLSRTVLRFAQRNVARHRKPDDMAYYQRLAAMHQPPRQSYAWIARRECLSRELVRYYVRKARGYRRR